MPKSSAPCPAFALALGLALVLALTVLPRRAEALVCQDGKVRLNTPVPKGDQLDSLFDLLEAGWNSPDKPFGEPELIRQVKAGRGGAYAAGALVGAKANGCNTAIVQLPSFLLLAELADNPFRKDPPAPVALLAYAPLALWVDEKSQFMNLADVLRYARIVQNPGQVTDSSPEPFIDNKFIPPVPELPYQPAPAPDGYGLSVAGVGSGTDQQLATLIFDRATGVKSFYVPVLGSAEAVRAVKDKKALACWGYALPGSMPGMRPVAVAALERSPAMPLTPTFREQKAQVGVGSYFALLLPGGSSEEVRKNISALALEAMTRPGASQKLEALGFQPMNVGYGAVGGFVEERMREIKRIMDHYPIVPKSARR